MADRGYVLETGKVILEGISSELLENKELRRKLGTEGRQIIEEQYSWGRIVQNLIKVYNKLLRN